MLHQIIIVDYFKIVFDCAGCFSPLYILRYHSSMLINHSNIHVQNWNMPINNFVELEKKYQKQSQDIITEDNSEEKQGLIESSLNEADEFFKQDCFFYCLIKYFVFNLNKFKLKHLKIMIDYIIDICFILYHS